MRRLKATMCSPTARPSVKGTLPRLRTSAYEKSLTSLRSRLTTGVGSCWRVGRIVERLVTRDCRCSGERVSARTSSASSKSRLSSGADGSAVTALMLSSRRVCMLSAMLE